MPDQTIIDQPKRQRCRHIFVDGRRCGSASLRHEDFCYYHHTTRHPVADPAARKARLSTLDLSIPEDRASIQLSIGLILQRIASNDLDPRRAGLLLYGLQIASSNLPPHKNLPPHAHPLPEQPLELVEQHPDHGLLAPPADALKTRDEHWKDIRREQEYLFQKDQDLRQREDKLREEQAQLRRDQLRLSQPAQQQTDQQEADPTQPDLDWLRRLEASASPSSPPAAPRPIPAILPTVHGETCENAMYSPLPGLTTRRRHGRIQPSNSPATLHDRHLQTPHRKDRLPRRGRRIRRMPNLRRDLRLRRIH